MNDLTWEQRLAIARQKEQQYAEMMARQQAQARMPWNPGGNMYAGGDPSFNERTGQRAPESGLAKLLMQGKNGLQGAWGEFQDWRNGLMPRANQQYNRYNHERIDRRVERDGG